MPQRNATNAQRRPRQARPGQLEAIAERRVRALELRKSVVSYRQIAEALAVDTHTAWADVAAELGDLREQTVEQAQELRALELERLDGMTAGLWQQIREGSPRAVSAAVRVSERRSRLLGLDAPVATKTELTGSLGVYAERLAAERDLFAKLDVAQLEELPAASEALVDRAREMVAANSRGTPTAVTVSPVGGVAHVASGTSLNNLPDIEVTAASRGDALRSTDAHPLNGTMSALADPSAASAQGSK